MNNIFKEDTVNNYYIYLKDVSQGGSDSNTGLDPDNAVASMNKLVELLDDYTGSKRRYAVIVKHKIYDEAITHVRNSLEPITFHFLNRTVIDGSGSSRVSFLNRSDLVINAFITKYNGNSNLYVSLIGDWSDAQTTFHDCIFVDNTRLNQLTGNSSSYRAPNFSKCVIKNTEIYFNGRNRPNYIIANDCVFDNVLDSGNNGLILLGRNIIFVNSNITKIENNSNFDYCNIFGDLSGLTDLDWKALGLNSNGISADPLFNDPANNVYSVQGGTINPSPCLYAGQNNQHIGIGEAMYITASQLLDTPLLNDNFELVSGKLIRVDPDADAKLRTKAFHNDNNRIINTINLSATLGLVLGNLEQSVQLDPTNGNPNPVFLSFKLKVAPTEAGLSTAEWITLPFNQQPQTDDAGKGNADLAFVPAEGKFVKLNWFQLEIEARNLS